MPTVTLARNAMATRFELVLHGANEAALRAAGEEALAEVDRLESQLSLYRPGSEIAQLNAHAAHEPVRVSPEVFALLQHAARLTTETEGAFDITIAPLVRCWGFMHQNGHVPTEAEIAAARAVVGMQHVLFNPAERTIRFAHPGVMLDLGAIGKGYAIERGAELLREAGVTSALFHGGTSTACAIGQPLDAEHWEVALPARASAESTAALPPTLRLRDESVSVSAIWGRSFVAEGKLFGHVIDPRLGQPVTGAALSVVILPSATETDALSTALLTLGSSGRAKIQSLRPGMRSWLVTTEGELLGTA
jgi:thiamine biosynthesis lipoprotein